MDRNFVPVVTTLADAVASREGGVDRNLEAAHGLADPCGRLPRGGRGSQLSDLRVCQRVHLSPPARGAWIATSGLLCWSEVVGVASREGGVDRNYIHPPASGWPRGRLPRGGRGSQPPSPTWSRGWWRVASREGGVDRNMQAHRASASELCRLPRGGRGSQPLPALLLANPAGVASREGGVDRNRPTAIGASEVSVASREGGVDRNPGPGVFAVQRRVASREGGVDRNLLRNR